MTEQQMAAAFESLKRTLRHTVISSACVAALISIVGCWVVTQIHVMELRMDLLSLQLLLQRLEKRADEQPRTVNLQQIQAPRTEHDNVLDVLQFQRTADIHADHNQ